MLAQERPSSIQRCHSQQCRIRDRRALLRHVAVSLVVRLTLAGIVNGRYEVAINSSEGGALLDKTC